MKITLAAHTFWATHFHFQGNGLTKNGLGYILGDFFSLAHLVTLSVSLLTHSRIGHKKDLKRSYALKIVENFLPFRRRFGGVRLNRRIIFHPILDFDFKNLPIKWFAACIKSFRLKLNLKEEVCCKLTQLYHEYQSIFYPIVFLCHLIQFM
jgi:hypothetical protein